MTFAKPETIHAQLRTDTFPSKQRTECQFSGVQPIARSLKWLGKPTDASCW